MRSHLLEGKVFHRRSRPVVYALEHDVFYFAIDLSELPDFTRGLALVSRNRPNLLGFRDDDHFLPPAADLDGSVRAHLGEQGIDPTGWRILLVTTVRTFGYLFNPASFYLCRDQEGVLRVVIVEVANTHNERRLYTLFPDRNGDVHEAEMDKDFYVSPFIDMDAHYRVRVWDRPDELKIAINEDEMGQPLLTASLVLRRVPMTNRNVARMLVRHPMATQKTIGLIHVHAFRLWRLGARFHRHGAAAAVSKGTRV